MDPKELVITNDSWKHANHAEMKVSGGGNGETRKRDSLRNVAKTDAVLLCTDFAVQVISDVFAGKVRKIFDQMTDSHRFGDHGDSSLIPPSCGNLFRARCNDIDSYTPPFVRS